MNKMDIVDRVSEMKLKAEALKALATVFGDAFTIERDPDKLAQAIRNRPETYTYLWYLIFDLIATLATEAGKIEEGMENV